MTSGHDFPVHRGGAFLRKRPQLFLLELAKAAAANLRRHKMRTSLTMLGMIFGVAAVLAMLAIGAGAEAEALSLIQRMGVRNIVVKAKEFDRAQLEVLRQDSPGLTRRDAAALQRVLPPGSTIVGKKQLKTYLVASALGKSDSRVLGAGVLLPRTAPIELVEGAFFLPIDEAYAHQVCVLGAAAGRKLFGLNSAIGEQIKINDLWFSVVGVLADPLSDSREFEGVKIETLDNDVYIPLATLLSKFEQDPIGNELDEIVIRLPAGANVAEQAALISSMVGSMHRQIDDFTMLVPARLLRQNRRTRRIFNIVMGAIASISLLVGGIGIMNIMLASVLERTGEIGLRRALGARRRDIGRQFILEALAISLCGALLGIGLGYLISNLVASYSGWPTIVRPFSLVLGIGVSVATGLVFGVYPARRAALVSPIEALRYE